MTSSSPISSAPPKAEKPPRTELWDLIGLRGEGLHQGGEERAVRWAAGLPPEKPAALLDPFQDPMQRLTGLSAQQFAVEMRLTMQAAMQAAMQQSLQQADMQRSRWS